MDANVAANKKLVSEKIEEAKKYNVTSLEIKEPVDDNDIIKIGELVNLRELTLGNAHSVTSIEPLRSLTSLQRLYLNWRKKLEDITPLSSLTYLQQLDLSGCEELVDITPLSSLTSLQHLNLSGCGKLKDIKPLSFLTSLQLLDLSHCGKLEDITPLSSLTSLRQLFLSWCVKLVDITPLSFLTSQQKPCLQQLTLCGCEKLVDITPLSSLTSLQQLNLSQCVKLENIKPLSLLTSLQHLNLSGYMKIDNLEPLRSLTSLLQLNLSRCENLKNLESLRVLIFLQQLDLSECKKLKNIKPLSFLTSLQHLDLSGCVKLVDITPLSFLTSLQHLDLSRCVKLVDITPLSFLASQQKPCLQQLNLRGCVKIDDLEPLCSLTFLQQLNLCGCVNLNNLEPLRLLTSLQWLYLSGCVNLENLEPLRLLTSLQWLYLSGCVNLENLEPLRTLTSLQQLNLSGCVKLKFLPICLINLPHLNVLKLYGTGIENVPSELLGDNWRFNCLAGIKAHFTDLEQGEQSDREVKLIVIGNGRVGKTSLCRRFVRNEFDSNENSTHGVKFWCKEISSTNSQEKPIDINIWDFGGQDIYYGTHRMFHNGRAVFLIAWDVFEQECSEDDQGNTFKNYPLQYWIEYVRSINPQAQVLLVQTKCGDNSEHKPQKSRSGIKWGDLAVRELHYDSAKDTPEDSGMLEQELFSASVQVLGTTDAQRIGVARWKIKKELKSLVAGGKKQTLTLEEYHSICDKHELMPESRGLLLSFLHNQGVLYYDSNYHSDVIIDQRWACDGVYCALDRKGFYNLQTRIDPKYRGQFTPSDMKRYMLPQYTIRQRDVLLKLMLSASICFKLGKEQESNEDVYLAPELIIPDEPDLPQWNLFASGTIYWRYCYRFLNPSVLRKAMVEIGGQYRQSVMYWHDGFYLYIDSIKTMARVYSQTGIDGIGAKGQITIEIKGANPHKMLDILRRSFEKDYRYLMDDSERKRYNLQRDGIEHLISVDGERFVSINDVINTLVDGNKNVRADDNTLLNIDDFKIFVSDYKDNDSLSESKLSDTACLTPTKTKDTYPEAQREIAASEEILFSWLHISDLHYGHGGASFNADRNIAMTDFETNIAKNFNETFTGHDDIKMPDTIFFTGDISHSGTKYDDVMKWLEDFTTKKIKVPVERIYVVPGNHDVNRNAGGDNTRRMIESILDKNRKDSLDESISKAGDRRKLKTRFKQYYKYFNTHLDESTFTIADSFILPDKLKILVFGFNTSLLCTGKERGDLEIGKIQLKAFLKFITSQKTENVVLFCLGHHPLKGECVRDYQDVVDVINKKKTIYLCGHNHKIRNEEIKDGHGNVCYHFVSSSLQPDEKAPNEYAYQIGALVRKEDGKTCLRVWPYQKIDGEFIKRGDGNYEFDYPWLNGSI